MTRSYFGTDGIRGTANRGNMTADVALKVGQAAGRREGDHGDGIGSPDPGREHGHRGSQKVRPGIVARQHPPGGRAVDPDRPGNPRVFHEGTQPALPHACVYAVTVEASHRSSLFALDVPVRFDERVASESGWSGESLFARVWSSTSLWNEFTIAR